MTGFNDCDYIIEETNGTLEQARELSKTDVEAARKLLSDFFLKEKYEICSEGYRTVTNLEHLPDELRALLPPNDSPKDDPYCDKRRAVIELVSAVSKVGNELQELQTR